MFPRRHLVSWCVIALFPLAAAPAQADGVTSQAALVAPGPERILPNEPWASHPALVEAAETVSPDDREPSGQPADAELTDLEQEEPERLLALITKEQAVEPVDYEPPDLVTVGGSDLELRAEVADQLEAMFAAAEEEGHDLRVVSAYRSKETQDATHDYWQRTSGKEVAEATSARPGHSEHQTGLAVDVDTVVGECTLDRCFGELDEGRWVAAQAHEFGFVISYPEGTRDRTGYTYEPWHLRYVGPRAAGEMAALDIALLQDYLSLPYTSVRAGIALGSGA